MKTYLLIVFQLLVIVYAHAQEVAALGAKFTYNRVGSKPAIMYLETEFVEEINGIPCKKVIGSDGKTVQYIYQQGNQVFAATTLKDGFYKLYDYDARVGDIVYSGPIFSVNYPAYDQFVYRVDSIVTYKICGTNRKVWKITSLKQDPVDTTVVFSYRRGERIAQLYGDLTYLFPQRYDAKQVNGDIRCFEDNVHECKFFGVETCELTGSGTTSTDDLIAADIRVIFNSNRKLHIQCKSGIIELKNLSLFLYTSDGSLVHHSKIKYTNQEINYNPEPGIIFYKVVDEVSQQFLTGSCLAY